MKYAFEAAQKAYHWHKGQMYRDRDYMSHLSSVAVTVELMRTDSTEQRDAEIVS